jgi:hypothetical protein
VFNLATFTLVHTLLSVVGILAGMVVVGGLMAGVRYNGWIATYLATTILTNATASVFLRRPHASHPPCNSFSSSRLRRGMYSKHSLVAGEPLS